MEDSLQKCTRIYLTKTTETRLDGMIFSHFHLMLFPFSVPVICLFLTFNFDAVVNNFLNFYV